VGNKNDLGIRAGIEERMGEKEPFRLSLKKGDGKVEKEKGVQKNVGNSCESLAVEER